ncbi:MAG: hypothetical protein ABIG39_02610 [Candidatus Micrarchaeota archaeon]
MLKMDLNKHRATVILVLLSILYLTEVPLVSLLSKLLVHGFLIGYFGRGLLGLKEKGGALFESFLLSMTITICAGMLIGLVVPLGDVVSKSIMLAVLWGLFRFSRITLVVPEISRTVIFIFLFSSVPLGLMLLLNPYTGFISDGWWHCSILNTIGGDTLPPANPWFSGAELAYPYSYHAYLFFATGGEMFCLHAFGLFAVAMMFFQALGIYYILKRFGGIGVGERGAVASSFVFTWASSIGGLFFMWDAVRIIGTGGISTFLVFLKDHHGPHMWHGAMKGAYHWLYHNVDIVKGITGSGVDVTNVGINLPFQGMAMVGAPQLLFIIGILYFLLKDSGDLVAGVKKSDVGVILCLAPLCANSPVNGVVAALALSLYLLCKRRISAIIPILLVAAFTAIVDSSYILAILGKGSHVGGSLLALPYSQYAPPTLMVLIIGFSPLIYFATQTLRKRTLNREVIEISVALIFSSFVVLFFMNLGYLYFTYPLFIGLALLAGPYFAMVLDRLTPSNLALIAILAILCMPNLLIIGSYIYYKPTIDQDQVDAADWIGYNTQKDSVFMQNLDLGGNDYAALCPGGKPRDLSWTEMRQTFLYSSVFGGRKNYLGDLRSLYVYGENFCPALSDYFSVFSDNDTNAICNLNGSGIDYLYVTDKDWKAPGCLIFKKQYGGVRIYETK